MPLNMPLRFVLMVNKDLHILQFCEGELVARNRVSINFFLVWQKGELELGIVIIIIFLFAVCLLLSSLLFIMSWQQ